MSLKDFFLKWGNNKTSLTFACPQNERFGEQKSQQEVCSASVDATTSKYATFSFFTEKQINAAVVPINEELEKINNELTQMKVTRNLHEISLTAVKKNRIIFIGQSNQSSNAFQLYPKLKEAIKNSKLADQVEVTFYVSGKNNLEILREKGIEAELFTSSPRQLLYALQAKIAVYTTHFAQEANMLLAAALAGSKKIQLWHGLPAKTIGCSTIKNNTSLLWASSLMKDCFGVDIVTAPLMTDAVKAIYQDAFPNARIEATGDPRTDLIGIKSDLLPNELKQWAHKHKKQFKILIAPTFRESDNGNKNYLSALNKLLTSFADLGVACAVRLHPGAFRFANLLSSACLNLSSPTLEVYACMDEFDALITDYSSIRIDFMYTGKPIIIWRPDSEAYSKTRNVCSIPVYDDIDTTAYHLSESEVLADFIAQVKKDPLQSQRAALFESLGLNRDHRSSERVAELILSELQHSF